MAAAASPARRAATDPERHGEGATLIHREEGRERLCEPFHDREREQQPEHPSESEITTRLRPSTNGEVPSEKRASSGPRTRGPLPGPT